MQRLEGHLLRIVESQEEVATLALVDSLDEQAELERLLEQTKPSLPLAETKRHYLLTTPFRYPPLRYGSRFATRFEPSLLYGSITMSTLFAEAAYYRFVFLAGMTKPLPNTRLLTEHTVFSAQYRAERGLDLTQGPFAAYQELLASPSNYQATQQLGADARAAGAQAIEFVSARDTHQGKNVGLIEPTALVSRRPRGIQRWFVETQQDKATFSRRRGQSLFVYQRSSFLVNGNLPAPAT